MRIGFDGLVAFDDLSRDWRVNVAGGFHGFHDSGNISGLHGFPNGWRLGKDDVGEFGLGVVGDTNRSSVALDENPLVGGGRTQVFRNVHGFLKNGFFTI